MYKNEGIEYRTTVTLTQEAIELLQQAQVLGKSRGKIARFCLKIALHRRDFPVVDTNQEFKGTVNYNPMPTPHRIQGVSEKSGV